MDKAQRVIAACLLVAGLAVSAPAAMAAGGGGPSWSKSSPQVSAVEKAIKDGDYRTAIALLEKKVQSDPRDADAWNLLGFSQRKLGQFDAAKASYDKALTLDPGHLGANEYLGELYLQIGDLPRAEERLARLDSLCFFGCQEYRDLKKAIEAYKAKQS